MNLEVGDQIIFCDRVKRLVWWKRWINRVLKLVGVKGFKTSPTVYKIVDITPTDITYAFFCSACGKEDVFCKCKEDTLVNLAEKLKNRMREK